MRTAIATVAAALLTLGGCSDSTQTTSAPSQRYQLTSEGVRVHSASDSRTVLLPGWIWVAAPHCPPVLAIGPNGEAVVTSNVVPMLWRIDPDTLAVSTHALALNVDLDKDVGFAGLFYSTEQAAFIAYSDIQRSVWKIDPALTRAEKLGASPDWKANFRLAQRFVYLRAGACVDPA
jgi:hypothetical protein